MIMRTSSWLGILRSHGWLMMLQKEIELSLKVLSSSENFNKHKKKWNKSIKLYFKQSFSVQHGKKCIFKKWLLTILRKPWKKKTKHSFLMFSAGWRRIFAQLLRFFLSHPFYFWYLSCLSWNLILRKNRFYQNLGFWK